jgi:Flagellar biosynthesis protein, FliO
MLNDLQPYLPILIIAMMTLIAVVILILIFKLFNQRVRGRRGQRLGITEFHEIDKTRRIVLVRRDDVEHLIMIGGNQDIVIESNIEGEAPNDASVRQRLTPEEPISMRPPKPAVFGSNRPILRSVEPSLRNGGRGEDELT